MTDESDHQEDLSAIAELLNRSSFGTKGARSLRNRVPREQAEKAVRQYSALNAEKLLVNSNQRREMTKELGTLSTSDVLFHLYGMVEVTTGGVRVGLGAEKDCRMVVPLLLAIRRPVTYLELADWLWDGSPTSAPDDLERYLGDFRASLAQLGLRGTLVNRDRLCRLNIAPNQVDLHRLRTVLTEVEQLDDHTAAGRLRETLALCAGEPLAGLSGHRIDSCRQTLLEERRQAELTLIRIDFRLGRAAHCLPDLLRLFRDRPEDTTVVILTMQALADNGRHTDALTVYNRCCERLIELGMKVPPQMAQLHLASTGASQPLFDEPAVTVGDTTIAPGIGRHAGSRAPRRQGLDQVAQRMQSAIGTHASAVRQSEQEPDLISPEPELTTREREVLKMIRSWVEQFGYPPSLREIGETVGLRTVRSVAYQLRALEQKGYLRRDPNLPRLVGIMPPEETES